MRVPTASWIAFATAAGTIADEGSPTWFSVVHIPRLMRLGAQCMESQPIRRAQHARGWTLGGSMSNKALISIVVDDELVREATRGLMCGLGFPPG
jgi:hypothetical protein